MDYNDLPSFNVDYAIKQNIVYNRLYGFADRCEWAWPVGSSTFAFNEGHFDNLYGNGSNLTGINIRYYFVQLFNDGVEQYYDDYTKTLQQVSLTINIGLMY